MKPNKNKKVNAWLNELASKAEPDVNECIEYLGENFEWLYELKNTPQDPEWHAEGNVHVHTDMVLAELYNLLDNEASHFNGKQRQALILGALFHDIAKPMRTKEVEINDVLRVASPQHESVGRSYLAFKLMELELEFDVVWNVLGLVGEHHMPKLLTVRNKAKGDYLALSRRANLELLYWLETADMKGRTCPDLPLQLQHLAEFKMFAEEYEVWNKPHSLELDFISLVESESDSVASYIKAHAVSELERGVISLPIEAVARTYEYKQNYSNLIVICGPSGSGKTTWIGNHCADHVLISLDDIREEINGDRRNQKNKGKVIHLARDRLKQALRDKQDIVWDATNLRSDFRKIICDLGRDYHALVTIVLFMLPESITYQNNRNREYAVPEDVLLKQFEDFQFPLVDEAHYFQIVGEKGELLYSNK